MNSTRAVWVVAIVIAAVLLAVAAKSRMAASEAQAALIAHEAAVAGMEVARIEAAASQDAEAAEPELVLADYMSQINRFMRRVKRGMEDPTKLDATLAALATAQAAAVQGKTLVPPYAQDIAEGERAEFIRRFRLTMIELAAEMLKIEKALLEGDVAAAAKGFENAKAIQKRGHDQFQEPE